MLFDALRDQRNIWDLPPDELPVKNWFNNSIPKRVYKICLYFDVQKQEKQYD